MEEQKVKSFRFWVFATPILSVMFLLAMIESGADRLYRTLEEKLNQLVRIKISS